MLQNTAFVLALVLVHVLVIRFRGGRPPNPQGLSTCLENDDEHERRFAEHTHYRSGARTFHGASKGFVQQLILGAVNLFIRMEGRALRPPCRAHETRNTDGVAALRPPPPDRSSLVAANRFEDGSGDSAELCCRID